MNSEKRSGILRTESEWNRTTIFFHFEKFVLSFEYRHTRSRKGAYTRRTFAFVEKELGEDTDKELKKNISCKNSAQFEINSRV